MKAWKAFPLLLAVMASTMSVGARATRADAITLSTSERQFLVTSYMIPGSGPRPAVLALSGSRGYGAKAYERLANALNSSGIDAFFIHFLSDEDIEAIEKAGSTSSRKAYYARRWDDWIASVSATASEIKKRSLYRGKVGLLGVSLGAAVATASASNSTDIAALVAVDGSFPESRFDRVKSLPPLLAIWGAADRVFSPAVGKRLRDFARSLGGDAELEIYERAPHAFFLDYENEQALRALARVRDFFVERLANRDRR